MDVSIAKGFVRSVGCLLTQIMVSFAVQELHHFTRSLSSVAGLKDSSIRVLVKDSFPVPGS